MVIYDSWISFTAETARNRLNGIRRGSRERWVEILFYFSSFQCLRKVELLSSVRLQTRPANEATVVIISHRNLNERKKIALWIRFNSIPINLFENSIKPQSFSLRALLFVNHSRKISKMAFSEQSVKRERMKKSAIVVLINHCFGIYKNNMHVIMFWVTICVVL